MFKLTKTKIIQKSKKNILKSWYRIKTNMDYKNNKIVVNIGWSPN